MSMEEKHNWLPLAQRYLGGDASGEETQRLEEKLLESPDTRAGFRRYTRTDVALRETSEAADRERALVDFRSSSRWPHGFWGWAQVAALFIMAGVIAALVISRGQGPEVAGDQEGEASGPVLVQGDDFGEGAMAVLTHAVGVEWAGDRAYAEGASLRPDTLSIESGLLQIEFFSGATVVVEGPAEFELVDPMNARCSRGRVRANVPHFARGFTIESEELKVVDLGTEFGFSAGEGGAKELHVFDGEVVVEGAVVGSEPRHLLSGTGIRFEGESIDYITPVEEAFADSEQIASLASAAADEQHRAWLRYSEGLKADSEVMLFYSFDNHVAWSRRLSNDKKMIADPLYGAIIGCRWAEGRWRGKAALEFKRASDRVRIGIPGEHDQLTLMAWVRIDAFDRTLNSLMLSDGWSAGGAHWQISQGGELILGVRGEGGVNGHYQSASVLGQQRLGEWLHLVVSYGGEGGEVVHYVNGDAVWRGGVHDHHSISVPRGELGNWSPGEWPPERGERHPQPERTDGRVPRLLHRPDPRAGAGDLRPRQPALGR